VGEQREANSKERERESGEETESEIFFLVSFSVLGKNNRCDRKRANCSPCSFGTMYSISQTLCIIVYHCYEHLLMRISLASITHTDFYDNFHAGFRDFAFN